MSFTTAAGSAFLVVSIAALASSGAACSSSREDDVNLAPARPAIEAGPPGDSGIVPGQDDGGPAVEPTEIVFGPAAAFAKRACTLTIRYEGAGSDVRMAGEFTDWGANPRPLAKTSSGFEIPLEPDAILQGGSLYAYILIVDG